MKHCSKCGVDMTGAPTRCPLCGGPLRGDNSPARFPSIPARVNLTKRFLQVCALATLASALLCLSINFAQIGGISWSLFVLLGIGSFWLAFAGLIQGKRNFVKTLMWQFFIIAMLAVVWDVFTGFHNWSLDYVIPILSACVLISLAVYARVTHLSASDYLVYIILCGLVGLGTAIMVEFDFIIHVKLPAWICGGVSIVSLLVLVIFRGRLMLSELRRRLHL